MTGKRVITTVILLIAYYQYGFSQVINTDSTVTVSPMSNTVTVSADKIANVFVFNGKADLFIGSKYGDISIMQNYKSNVLRTFTTYIDGPGVWTVPFTALRDDEDLKFRYSYPFGKALSLSLIQRLIVSSDNISSGINDLRRLNTQAGLTLKNEDNLFFDLTGGLENNKSLGIETGGLIFGLNSYARNIDILDVNTNTSLTGEFLSYNDNRKYADLNIQAEAQKNYENNGTIALSFHYKKQNRDLLVPRYITLTSFPIERRFEDKIGADFRIGFMLFDPLSSNLLISINNQSVDRQYNHSIDNVDQSYISKNLNEFRLSFAGSLEYLTENFKQTASLAFDTRDERNKIYNLFGLDKTKEENLKNLDYQRDNITTTTRLSAKTTWLTNRTDTLNADYSMSLLRYDTPSKDNDDERDQFNLYFKAIYLKYFSEYITVGINTELQLSHLVNLKARLSAGNYWNRVIRLAPELRIKSRYFTATPVFEVLANYTVFDYEDVSASIRSYSLRQISYRDTIFVPIDFGYSLQSSIIMKYHENGQLLWMSFSEAPQRSNFEKFLKLMIIKNIDSHNFFGFGFRYYNFESKNIGSGANMENFATNPVTSYGLETILNFSFFNNSKISLQGWYEFQKVSNKEFKTFPNFFILTVINL